MSPTISVKRITGATRQPVPSDYTVPVSDSLTAKPLGHNVGDPPEWIKLWPITTPDVLYSDMLSPMPSTGLVPISDADHRTAYCTITPEAYQLWQKQ